MSYDLIDGAGRKEENENSDSIRICASWKYRKLVKRIAEECQVDLIDAVKQLDADMSDYDMIGFASGIYFQSFISRYWNLQRRIYRTTKRYF